MTTDSDINAKVNDSEYCGLSSDHNVGDDTDTDAAAAASTTPYSILPSDEDRETIINDALDELAEIARENILEFKREDFNDEEVVGSWIDSYLCEYFSEMIPHRSDYSTATAVEAEALNDVLDAYIRELYDELFERFYEEIAPHRSTSGLASGYDCAVGSIAPVGSVNGKIIGTVGSVSDDTIRKMTEKIQILREKPQPDQRTPEWYARRNNLITASAASKAFGSQASINQLVYEKCKNYVASGSSGSASGPPSGPLQGSVHSPLHWGQRYEPLTVMVYERRNNTKLGEFGCIQHDTYPFIGASPDGINVDPASRIYGRMVEIKNIVNREITGRPKEEYWIQTQIQMEVCDLDECDFVETRFKEYDSAADYIEDTPATDTDTDGDRGYSANGNEKGIILWFQTAPALTYHGYVSQPIQLYEYAPIGMTTEEYDTWEAAVFEKHQRDGNIWVRTIHWYLDEYSCVLVRRNRLWFSEAVKVLEQVWTMIEEERETGFEHRAPKKKPAAAGGGGTNGPMEFTKIVKLDTAIVDAADAADAAAPATTEVTATKMATMMSYYNKSAAASSPNSMKRPTADGTKRPSDGTKRPSDTLIKCFKIDDLELDESKV